MQRRNFVIHTPDEIIRIKRAAHAAALVREQVAAQVCPGMTTKQLDDLAGGIIRATGGIPTFLGYCGYPANICISVNDQVVHGIGNDKTVIREGDLVSVDVGVTLDGAVGDTAKTVFVGETIPDAVKRLMEGTQKSLQAGIRAAKGDHHVHDISKAVETVAKEYRLGVVRDLVGHGCGTVMHEPPEVPNFVAPHCGVVRLVPGMVLCIEPMLNLGTHKVYVEPDGWTVRTADGKWSAHYEHMVLITEGQAEVLTSVE